jgi:hypothetical protein
MAAPAVHIAQCRGFLIFWQDKKGIAAMFVQFSIRPVQPLSLEQDATFTGEPLDRLSCDDRQSLRASIEGSWDEVMSVIRNCQQALVAGQPRVVTTIVVVEDRLNDQSTNWPRCLQEGLSVARQQIVDSGHAIRRIPVSV